MASIRKSLTVRAHPNSQSSRTLDPPPSTLAANLVNNLSNARKPANNDDQEDFQRLLVELSLSNVGGVEDLDIHEKILHHHKLIYVLAKATIGPLSNDALFHRSQSPPEQQLQQALEAFDILVATVKETPEVLSQVAGPYTQSQKGSQVPLWLWILPQILPVLGRPNCESLEVKARELLCVCFHVTSRSTITSEVSTLIFCYFKHCIQEILERLQDPGAILGNGTSTISIRLPPTTVEDDLSLSGNPDLHLEGCDYTIAGAESVLKHGALLLATIVEAVTSSITCYDVTPALQADSAWIMEGILLLSDIAKSLSVMNPGLYSFSSIQEMFVDAMVSLLSNLNAEFLPSLRRKCFRLLSVLVSELDLQDGLIPRNSSRLCAALGLLLQKSEHHTIQDLITNGFEKQLLFVADECLKNSQCTELATYVEQLLRRSSKSEFSLIADRLDKYMILRKSGHDRGHLIKRRKLLDGIDSVQFYNHQLHKLLGLDTSASPFELSQIAQLAASPFTKLDDAARCRVFECLQHYTCSIANTLCLEHDSTGAVISTTCTLCDDGQYSDSNILANAALNDIVKTFEILLNTPEVEASRNPRLQAMMTLQCLVKHSQDVNFLDLESSFSGQWCLKSLKSSIRQLRVTAGRSIVLFISMTNEHSVRASNRQNVLDILREISVTSPEHQKETCIMAWGQIGRIATEQELNLVLIQLIDYFNSPNQILSDVAFNELLLLAEALELPIRHMLAPYWRSLGPIVIKDLQTRPQCAQLTADALSISVADLLILIQSHTLPWLIQMKRKDLIVKISHARRDEDYEDPWRLCFENANIASILATLLVQNVPDLEVYIMDLLRNVSSHFNGLDLTDLLRVEPIGIAVELLKNAGEEDESRKSRVRYALQFLSGKITPLASESQPRRISNSVGTFLEQYVLGIITQFSDVLNDMRGWQSNAEKRRSLRGLEELLRMGRSHIRSAIPQVTSCLQSAISQSQTCDLALSAWVTMVRSLDDEDAGLIIESTFSLIIATWPIFDQSTREAAKSFFSYLLEKRKSLLQDYIESIPSLDQVPELEAQNTQLNKLRRQLDVRNCFQAFSVRLGHEHANVISQALFELARYLRKNQELLQVAAVSDQPDPIVGQLLRAVLDACVRFNGSHVEVARLSAECLGLIGCVDSNRVQANRESREMIVVSNFDDASDTTDFVLFILEEVLVRAFLSATNPKAQGFLGYAIQELLEKCDFRAVCSMHKRPGDHHSTEALYKKWTSLPESVLMTLTPFLKSKYVVTELLKTETEYPIYKPGKKYSNWLRSFVLDLLERPNNVNTMLVFAPLCRVIRIQDTSVASFLLPYVVLHAIASGTDEQRYAIRGEMMTVLGHDLSRSSHIDLINVKMCSEAIFRVLDYLSKWVQEKQTRLSRQKGYDAKLDRGQEGQLTKDPDGIRRVLEIVNSIPAEVISSRAVECNSYARALFHWETYIRQTRAEVAKQDKQEKQASSIEVSGDASRLQRLQDIYAQIDEPDGIEGISAHLSLDMDQQILGHRKNGRWAAAQSWYEIKLAEDPDDIDSQTNLLQCLKESGQHDVLLNYVEGMKKENTTIRRLLPFATEAAWTTGRWALLAKYSNMTPQENGGDFNVILARMLLHLHSKQHDELANGFRELRDHLAGTLSVATASSLGSCHEDLLKFHVLTELEMIVQTSLGKTDRHQVLETFDRRLEILGAYRADKQYILGLRRAAMQLLPQTFSRLDVASAWLTSAKLARKGNSMHQSFNAVLHASKLGDASATIEHARLLWKGGNSRQAIQSLESAIDGNAFISHNQSLADNSKSTNNGAADEQNLLAARAHLLLAKWLDSAGQTHSAALRSQYQQAAKLHLTWEKGHYYLGRHYNKLLEAERSLPLDQQSQPYLSGETAKLVVENYLRSLNYGTKYIYQTLPRLLTLWLNLGTQVNLPPDPKAGNKEWQLNMVELRKEQLKHLHAKLQKYMSKMPAYIFYTALPQIVARIAHPNTDVYKLLRQLILKVVQSYPQQALWTLFAVSTSTQQDRKTRGMEMISALRAAKKAEAGALDLRTMMRSGEKLANDLLVACNAGDFEGNRSITASLSKDLGFNQRQSTPSPLVVPIQATLTATLPTLTDKMSKHKAFSRDAITISSFMDEVIVLSSLQKPRKLTARGSDGKLYGLMCKPKDDLRKDQRLMEFNSMINRSLKRDAESSKRQLYIKTYAVTPLNEECGIIEWVDGLKTLRDILLGIYKAHGITPNYSDIKIYLDEASKGGDKLAFFTEKILGDYPPIFHLWFVQQFPDPDTWFTARLRYTRSCAVMSMVGTILGLGDRHGENILFEEGNGGTFHVDFNCLFDKGLTFAQPERVPFRLTHNMVDAMGPYGYEGPFRKSSELTLALLRQHEETLMTILEAFVYDPTLDLVKKNGKSRRRGDDHGHAVPDTAQGVLEAIRRKVKGLLAGESVPLGVEGQVDELIKMAVSPKNLANMYIGWCAFF